MIVLANSLIKMIDMKNRLLSSILLLTVIGVSCKRNTSVQNNNLEEISQSKKIVEEEKKEKEESTADLGPSFSPDGKKLVFYSYLDEGIAHLFTINIDGTGLQDISKEAQSGWHAEPIWSPDGKKIAFTNFLEKGAKLMVIDSNGKNYQQLASVSENGFHMFSSWDATGEGYYFFHWPINEGFKPDVYHAKEDVITRLTSDGITNRPQLAANGTLFISKIIDVENNIYSKHILDENSQKVIDVPNLDGWFITGNHVLKQEEQEDETIFILEDLNGNDIKELGKVPFKSVMFSKIDPNFNYVAYNTSFEDGAEIHLLEIATGKIVKLTENE